MQGQRVMLLPDVKRQPDMKSNMHCHFSISSLYMSLTEVRCTGLDGEKMVDGSLVVGDRRLGKINWTRDGKVALHRLDCDEEDWKALKALFNELERRKRWFTDARSSGESGLRIP
jgi:hypothetical protein